ncbi:hypothetical protein ACM66B_000614 [Microbotryomycetes sp. NB124-2]
MDSLGRLSDTLPGSEAAEKELQASFRSAALALTSLFKQGKKATNKAYISGKREALQDVLEFVQASLDHPATPSAINVNGQLNVARLMDYICARQETLKAEEEGEDEDEAAAPPLHRQQQHSQSHSSVPSRSSFNDRRPPPPQSTALAPVTRPGSTAPPPPRDHSAPVPAPVASTSSSVPSSPAFTRHGSHISSRYAPEHMSRTASTSIVTATPAGSTTPSCPSSPAPGSGAQTPVAPHQSPAPLAHMSQQPTPLTRAQARREKASNGNAANTSTRRLKSSSGSGASKERSARGAQTAVGVNVDGELGVGGGGESGAHSAATTTTTGIKRRWANVSTTDLTLDDFDHSHVASLAESGSDESHSQTDDMTTSAGDGDAGDDHMEMEMEGWNGSGERPPKRVARTGLR